MSRPRKPTATLKLHGDYRADRHGDRSDDQAELGKPSQPKMSSPAARAEWQRLVKRIPPGVLGELDTGLLRMACEQFAVYCQATKDGEYQEARKAGEFYIRSLAKLGLTPVDRPKLNWGPKETKQDGLQARKRG